MADDTPKKKTVPQWKLEHRIFSLKIYWKHHSYVALDQQLQAFSD